MKLIFKKDAFYSQIGSEYTENEKPMQCGNANDPNQCKNTDFEIIEFPAKSEVGLGNLADYYQIKCEKGHKVSIHKDNWQEWFK